MCNLSQTINISKVEKDLFIAPYVACQHGHSIPFISTKPQSAPSQMWTELHMRGIDVEALLFARIKSAFIKRNEGSHVSTPKGTEAE